MDYPTFPAQQKGNCHDTVSMRCLDARAEADAFYRLVSERLALVNAWHELPGGMPSTFTLCDPEGNALDREPRRGDYIRIDIPGPGSPAGQGYDWVRVADVHSGESPHPFYGFTVRPCENPATEGGHTAHFYQNDASSTFIVRQLGHCVQAEVHGRNEERNTEGSLLDRARNQLVAIGGMLGLSNMQWRRLADGLVGE
jgi:hypothetical protein